MTTKPPFSASAISDSVPGPPPTATTASAARTTSPLRSSPNPVGIATSTQPLAAERSSPGRSPTVVPWRERAPRQAASITPPSPPVTMVAPASASSAPTSSASAHCASVASIPAPTTATYTTSAHDDVDEAAGDDDHLDDVLAVDVRAHVRCGQRQALELRARRAGRGLHAVADPAVDLADKLIRVALEVGQIRAWPRLVPHPPPGQPVVGVGRSVGCEAEQQRGRRRQRE